MRRDPRHLRIGVQKDQSIPLQPRLVADVLTRRCREVPAREARAALGPAERTYRRRLLETDTPTGGKRTPYLYTALEKPQVKGRKVRICERIRELSYRHPSPAPHADQTPMARTY